MKPRTSKAKTPPTTALAATPAHPEHCLVAYNHVTGQPYLVDPVAGTCVAINVSLPEGADALKDERGHYRHEVKMEAKRLYMTGMTRPEVAERMSIPVNTIHKWVAGVTHDEGIGWAAERRKMLEDVRLRNAEVYGDLERKALGKVEAYLDDPQAQIMTPADFAIFASGVEKLNKSLGTAAKIAEARAAASATQVNVNVGGNTAPLTPTEMRQVLENDPIKRIAQARTREEASVVATPYWGNNPSWKKSEDSSE